MLTDKNSNVDYKDLVDRIGVLYEQGRRDIISYINAEIVKTY